jgi:hypothetical protein
MPAKLFELEDIGSVKFFKRKGTRSIRISVTSPSDIRVTMPTWVPYGTAVAFVRSRQEWIQEHQKPAIQLQESAAVGKAHHLRFIPSNSAAKPTVRLVDTEIKVTYPANLSLDDNLVQQSAHRGVYRALKQEAEQLLPGRLEQLAGRHGFTFTSVTCKRMRSRWGSCSHKKDIALNVFLMQLPWKLIDYVLLHELVHTKVLHHGPDFWLEFENCLPGAKKLRKELKAFQPAI